MGRCLMPISVTEITTGGVFPHPIAQRASTTGGVFCIRINSFRVFADRGFKN